MTETKVDVNERLENKVRQFWDAFFPSGDIQVKDANGEVGPMWQMLDNRMRTLAVEIRSLLDEKP